MLLLKNSIIKIRKQLGRFLSLILIVALGSAFFAGVRETSSDMIKTLDEYYDETNLLDFRIVSTMGLTDDDLNAIKELENTYIVEENYSYETVIDGDATKIYGITDKINNIILTSGNLPKNNNECLVMEGSYNIGDTITIIDENYTDYLKTNTFKVVGTIRSSMYVYKHLGTSTVSDGKLDNFIYIHKDNFNLEYYTEIYIIAKDSQEKTSYKDDYEEQIEILREELEELAPIQETIRYEQIKTEAMEEIYDAREKIENERQKNEKTFATTLADLNYAQLQITNGLNQIESGYTEIENQKTSIEQEFLTQETTLNESLNTINKVLQSQNITTTSIDASISDLENKINSINLLLSNLDPTSEEYIKYSTIITQLTTLKSNLEEIKNGYTKLEEGKTTWEQTYESTINELNTNKENLLNKQTTLDEAYEEYNEKYALFQEEINKNLKEISDAEAKISKLEKPKWYLFDREDNAGYTTFLDSATKVDSIAAVFPIFFIVIAFLMCLNTMTRMIEEERTEIGIFTSLGISRFKITMSYVVYVFIATILGILIGLTIGYTVVPRVLYKVYTSAFIIPSLKTYANIPICITIIEVCILTMTLVTIYSVNKKFILAPATLLRPESPKNGRKVLLEKINFIWKRISFSWKVTFRNLFRYTKRIIMTLVGISGCTALLLTGFGIRDSISKIVDIQFTEIQKYDSMLILDEELSAESQEINTFLANNNIDNPLYTHTETLTFQSDGKKIDCYLFAFPDNDITQYFNLTDTKDNQLSLSDNGAIIVEKMANTLNVDVGDTITLRDTNNEIYVIKIAGISKNYVNNYIYMNKEYYELAFNNKITYNSIITNIADKGNIVMDSNYFSTIQYSDDNMDMLNDIINNMRNIVYLILGFSSFLAITVLYNLTSINISERLREIATLKVLGFNNKEISMYVYRETIILTTIGIAIGLILGIGLDYFVLVVAEPDEIIFIKEISYLSYIFTVIIMVFFTILVQAITSIILKKINMIDSLKSVE